MRYLQAVLLLFTVHVALAEDNDAADLRLRINSGEQLQYTCTTTTSSSSSGRYMDKPFTLSKDTVTSQTIVLKALAAKPEGVPIAIRFQGISEHDKESFGEERSAEITWSRDKVKCIRDGKVIIDTENDIGMDQIGPLQDSLKVLENSEARMIIDSTGRQGELQGDPLIVDAIRATGVNRLLPGLPGKAVKPGESWDDNYSLPSIGEFKLAKPAVVRLKLTFSKWENKDGRRLALIDIVCAWEHTDLKGENPKNGMLVEISGVDSKIIGSCHFDPASGRFVDYKVVGETKYHMDGEKDGQKMGLDVVGKSEFSFTEKK